MSTDGTRLGYLMVGTPVSNVYIGGLMVVDSRGLPLEFRYTEPIQPSKIQQVLYGSALGRFIKTEVILGTLLASVDHKPDLLIVSDDSFLSGTDEALKGYTVARIMETRLPTLRPIGTMEKASPTEFLLQLTPEGSPVRVQLPTRSPEAVLGEGPLSLPDKSTGVDDPRAALPFYDLLVDTGRYMDIMEPMQRVEKALAMLCQEAGFKPSSAA